MAAVTRLLVLPTLLRLVGEVIAQPIAEDGLNSIRALLEGASQHGPLPLDLVQQVLSALSVLTWSHAEPAADADITAILICCARGPTLASVVSFTVQAALTALQSLCKPLASARENSSICLRVSSAVLHQLEDSLVPRDVAPLVPLLQSVLAARDDDDAVVLALLRTVVHVLQKSPDEQAGVAALMCPILVQPSSACSYTRLLAVAQELCGTSTNQQWAADERVLLMLHTGLAAGDLHVRRRCRLIMRVMTSAVVVGAVSNETATGAWSRLPCVPTLCADFTAVWNCVFVISEAADNPKPHLVLPVLPLLASLPGNAILPLRWVETLFRLFLDHAPKVLVAVMPVVLRTPALWSVAFVSEALVPAMDRGVFYSAATFKNSIFESLPQFFQEFVTAAGAGAELVRCQALLAAICNLKHHVALRVCGQSTRGLCLSPSPLLAAGCAAAVRDGLVAAARCALVAWRPELQVCWLEFLATNSTSFIADCNDVFNILAALLPAASFSQTETAALSLPLKTFLVSSLTTPILPSLTLAFQHHYMTPASNHAQHSQIAATALARFALILATKCEYSDRDLVELVEFVVDPLRDISFSAEMCPATRIGLLDRASQVLCILINHALPAHCALRRVLLTIAPSVCAFARRTVMVPVDAFEVQCHRLTRQLVSLIARDLPPRCSFVDTLFNTAHTVLLSGMAGQDAFFRRLPVGDTDADDLEADAAGATVYPSMLTLAALGPMAWLGDQCGGIDDTLAYLLRSTLPKAAAQQLVGLVEPSWGHVMCAFSRAKWTCVHDLLAPPGTFMHTPLPELLEQAASRATRGDCGRACGLVKAGLVTLMQVQAEATLVPLLRTVAMGMVVLATFDSDVSLLCTACDTVWARVDDLWQRNSTLTLLHTLMPVFCATLFQPAMLSAAVEAQVLGDNVRSKMALLLDRAEDHLGTADAAVTWLCHRFLASAPPVVSKRAVLAFSLELAAACLLPWGSTAAGKDGTLAATRGSVRWHSRVPAECNHWTRAVAVTTLVALLNSFASDVATQAEVAAVFVTLFVRANAKLDVAHKSFFQHSPVHLEKLRIWQALCVLIPFVSADFAKDLLSRASEWLFLDGHPSIRYFMEMVLASVVTRYPQHFSDLINPLSDAAARPGIVVSIIVAVLHASRHFAGRGRTDVIDRWAPLVMQHVACWSQSSHKSIRSHVVHALSALFVAPAAPFKAYASSQASFEGILHFVLSHAESVRAAAFLANDFVTNDLVLSRDVCVEFVFCVAPLIFNFRDCAAIPRALLSAAVAPWSMSYVAPAVGPESCAVGRWVAHQWQGHELEHLLAARATSRVTQAARADRGDTADATDDDGDDTPELTHNPTSVINGIAPHVQRKHLAAGPVALSTLVVVASLLEREANVGGICRTCEIFGAQTLAVADDKVLQSREATALSVHAEKWMPHAVVPPAQLVPWLLQRKAAGYTLVGVEQTASSQNFAFYKFPAKTVLVVGRERDGIPATVLRVLDASVEIPQFGVTGSLNAHVSAALAIWEVCFNSEL